MSEEIEILLPEDAQADQPEEKDEAQSLEVKTEGRKRRRFQLRFCHVSTALAFLVPFLMMICIFIGNEIYPFGKRSFLFSDMYHQYMPFFQEFMQKIKAGEGIDYSWNVGIGSNFLALYVYYLASPFNWLAFLFPADHLMEFMSYAVVFKIGLAGLTAFLYLRSREGFREERHFLYGALVCSTFYAMSGFVAAYNWNVMWMDCVVLLPLILMGLERLVRQGKPWLYVFSLGLCIYTNFYLSIMICLFLVLYYVFLFLTEKKNFAMVWKFALGSLLAGGLAAILLIPEVQAIMATDFGKMEFPKKWESYFSILDVVARHCATITTERALEHWPNIYCGAMVFFMIPLYAVNEKIPAKRRFGFLAMMGIFLLSFSTNILDFIWHGLNYPDSLPARQSFIYAMIVLVACHDCFAHLEGITGGMIVKSCLGAVAFFLFVEKFVEVTDFKTWTWLLNLAFVVVYALCLYLYKTKESYVIKYVVACLAFAVVIGESSANMASTSVGTTDREAYLKHVKDYSDLYERNARGTEGFSRAEKFTRKTKNDAVLSGFPSASVFSSTMNSKVMSLYTDLGIQHSKVYYGYDGATTLIAALLNVNYVFGESEEWENELFHVIDKQNGIYLYESKYKVPFGYVAPEGFELNTEANETGVEVQNDLARQLGVFGNLLTRVNSHEDGDDVTFAANTPGIYYGCVTKYGTSKLKLSGSEIKERNYKDLKKGTMFYVGYLEQGQSIRMKNGDDADKTPKVSIAMYRLDVENLERAVSKLQERHMTDVTVSNRDVSGKLSLSEAGRLILSIPVDDGWTVWVNGQVTEPGTFGKALIALDLGPGEYEIRLHYQPKGKMLGIAVTCVSILIVAAIFIVKALRKKKNKNNVSKDL